MGARLHMVQVELDVRRLLRKGRAAELPSRRVDTGYLMHCALFDLFGEYAPRPFDIIDHDRHRILSLGYSKHPADLLIDRAKQNTGVDAVDAAPWGTIRSKPMPTRWREGKLLQFEVRVCPTVRRSGRGVGKARGPETDAFIAACLKKPDEHIDREEIYRQWLAGRVARDGAAELDQCSMRSFRRVHMMRRTQGTERKAVIREKPDARFVGTIRVGDPKAFGTLLSEGVGRHRAFGFGMLKVRPSC